jgi:alkanesulfonate monooxygenase SsuD/methylene tetrahydromethanopterin reductase-like flavin-dependent oxidoreductase (luciferase family)
VKVFVELGNFAASCSRRELESKVRELEDLGVYGVSLWDHLFVTHGFPRAESPLRPCDPLTTLAAIAGLSDKLAVQTVVMNSMWSHPAILLRQFAQLAVFIGGDRVTAGLGTGWNAEEFTALGMKMRPFQERLTRLEETMQIARQLYRPEAVSTFDGTLLSTDELPLSPLPSTFPRLLVGGGSDRVLEIAGKYADVIDLVGDPRHGSIAGRTMKEKHAGDVRRRALTTVSDLAERVELIRQHSESYGRPRDAVDVSVQIWYVCYGNEHEISTQEERICRSWGQIEPQSLRENPYLLMGTPRQIADTLMERRDRMGLSQILLRDGDKAVIGGELRPQVDAVSFCRDVLPLIS